MIPDLYSKLLNTIESIVPATMHEIERKRYNPSFVHIIISTIGSVGLKYDYRY
jgi:hypothetical protein